MLIMAFLMPLIQLMHHKCQPGIRYQFFVSTQIVNSTCLFFKEGTLDSVQKLHTRNFKKLAYGTSLKLMILQMKKFGALYSLHKTLNLTAL